MEAKELMIGDWVYLKTDEYGKQPCKVREILGHRLIVSNLKGYVWSNEDTEEWFEPIPLTPEMLLKNGFVRKYEDCFIVYENKDYVQIEMGINHRLFADGRFYLREVIHRLHYIHELQHALRLCGRTELADNFKVE